jgi:Holliday junction resolvase RusA-like endonuclease
MVASYNRKQGVAHVHHQQGEALAAWRGAVRIAARGEGIDPSPLAIRLSIRFGMPRPKDHLELRGGRYVVKMQHYYDRPAVAPDIDKLIRAVADALTGTAYRDDSQIVEVLASKVYADSTYIEVTDEDLSPQVEAFRSTVPAGLGVNTPKDTGKG